MGRKGRSSGLPRWYKGRKVLEHYSGYEYCEDDGKTFIRDGKRVDKANYDTVTEEERANQIQRRIR